MLDKQKAQDAILAGHLTARAFVEEFLVQWNLPDIEREIARNEKRLAILWRQLPPEVHAALRAQDKDAYNAAEKRVKEIEKGEHLGRPDAYSSIDLSALSPTGGV